MCSPTELYFEPTGESKEVTIVSTKQNNELVKNQKQEKEIFKNQLWNFLVLQKGREKS